MTRRTRTEEPLRVGMTCYPTMGGSGVIATEVGLALAEHGHDVHFVCADVPERLRPLLRPDGRLEAARVTLHRVQVSEYLLPHMGSYPLALATALAQVTMQQRLDVWHLHYAVPHAVSALLGRQLLLHEGPVGRTGMPRVVVTMHGTDVTGVGSDVSLRAVNRMALRACDGLTVPSRFLRAAAYDQLGLPAGTPIEVIPNLVDTDRFVPPDAQAVQGAGRPWTLCHASNFRPLKRIDDVVQVFARVRAQRRPGDGDVRLLLIGEGPERPRIEALVQSLGLSDCVEFRGFQHTLVDALQGSDVFLLPSETESFGLAALEAMSCGVPVVASQVGGLPEVIEEGRSGFLCRVGDVAGMADAVLQLRHDPARAAAMSGAARRAVVANYSRGRRVAQYEAFYRALQAAEHVGPGEDGGLGMPAGRAG